MSVGFASLLPEDDLSDLIDRADAALTAVKAGR